MKSVPTLAFLLILLTNFIPNACVGHGATVSKEYEQTFTTYPYSDPDPVPTMSRFYPYFRYDGFTDRPMEKKWKVVELSNDYLQLLILPEVGGKIWAAIEKSTGRSFIYFNHVVKFRDVSMRGPWTSGGMEPNYGIMGHTPNCFTPVDYLVRHNPDGSASCFIGVLDLLTRSWWRLEINLPADQACFSTRSFWHNASSLEEPYYTWMNVGIKAGGNLQFINPGTKYLGHDGRAFSWPTNESNGRDISWYENNNFGSYKSYHVFGRPAEFFGGYWHDEDFGMARCSSYADKPGRKIWIWGLSREGMIWENLLTDHDGQYVEVQSGRLFNQADESSTLTPFKHKGFPPYATDTWTEYWEPVKATKGFVSASPWGALNVSRQGNDLLVRISPTRALQDQLEVRDGNQLLWSRTVELRPMKLLEATVKLPLEVKALTVRLGNDKLVYNAEEESSTRPTETPSGFDWNSFYGLYLKGREAARQRAYAQAEAHLERCLKVDPDFAPALVEMAALANRRADYRTAQDFSRRALSVDTYDPEANYQFGLASAALGRQTDARDGFSVACLSVGWRSAAATELARQFLRERRYDRALSSVAESLRYDSLNMDALQLQACIFRVLRQPGAAHKTLEQLLEVDPLNHFARFESYRLGTAKLTEVTSLIRNELPQETYLELAVWYHGIGLDEEASKLLELAPAKAEVLYWLAYLKRDPSLLTQAAAATPAFVFPFRRESIPVFEWAGEKRPGWQPKYFLALIYWSQGQLPRARQLLEECGNEPPFAAFYAARAQVTDERGIEDLDRACKLDPQQWRFGAMLARAHLKRGGQKAALEVAQQYVARFPENNVLAVIHAKTLLAAEQFEAAAQMLSSLKLLPCEGSTEARSLFREANLVLAAQNLNSGNPAAALNLARAAREWPERLGSGRPYDEDLDERLDDWFEYCCLAKANRSAEASAALDRVLNAKSNGHGKGIGELARALALQQSGHESEAQQLLNDWSHQDPSSEWAKWGLQLLKARSSEPPESIHAYEARVLAASLK